MGVLAKIGGGVRSVIQGDVVSSRFFMKHFFSTCMIVLAAIVMIALRFECATSQNTVDRLNRQINVMSTEKQKERSRYMTLTRESAMLHLVDSLRLGLTIPDRRPEIVEQKSK
ncbi:MAG: FtsL-like putative cell division protein [Muribaculaceae bacterium]|nr:FtsL-like putative cell division protein [Muribaculaceae bacterium]